jgi:hypothetical protein
LGVYDWQERQRREEGGNGAWGFLWGRVHGFVFSKRNILLAKYRWGGGSHRSHLSGMVVKITRYVLSRKGGVG